MHDHEKPDLIIFDVEGTLVDCAGVALECWERTLRDFSLQASVDELKRYAGADGDLMLRRLNPRLDQEFRKRILGHHQTLYEERYLHTVSAFPGAHETLSALHRRGATLALATTCSRPELQHYDRLIDVESLCAVVECGSEVSRGKPYPDLFEAVLAKLRRPPMRTLAVGDTPFDAEAAKASGLPTIGVLTGGFSAAQLLAAGCIAVISDVTELLNTTLLL
jgi:HAD superfamily hydrolase (TIGR01509 family)